jgi:WD40 repeat protein
LVVTIKVLVSAKPGLQLSITWLKLFSFSPQKPINFIIKKEVAMKNLFLFFFSLIFIATVMPGCKRENLVNEREASTAPDAGLIPPAFKHDRGEWTVPVHLGPEVNSPSAESGAAISPDGLSLYFNSDRPGLGAHDIYVSRRACLECPWEKAQNLGAPINGLATEAAPALSHDGHLLFFTSNRVGQGGLDLWMSRRKNPNDDFGWEAPINLGPLVNSAADDGGPSYVVAAAGEHAELYFDRGQSTTWVAPISRGGEVLAPPVQVDLGGEARGPSVRKDGRELVFWAGPGRGGLGDADIWVSTRHNITDSWSTPVNIGAPVNTAGGDLEAGISDDGNTLVFSGTMTRGSSLGRQDIWITTRAHHQ